MATGNTIGKLQYAPAPQGNVAAGSANPPKKKSWWSSYGDWVHTGLDVLGAVPIVGVVADGANAAIYTAEGDYGNAALSAASAAANFVPGGGAAFKAGKLAAKTGKALEAAKAGKAVAKEGAELTEKAIVKSEKAALKAEGKVAKEETGLVLQAKKAGSEKGGSNKGKGGKKQTESCKNGLLIGNPVNPLLGIKVLAGDDDLDFAFPAAVPLNWQRYYYSDELANGWLGQGWFLPFSPEVRETDDVLRYIDEQGREIDFPRIAPGLPARLHRYEQLTLSQPKQGLYRLTTSDEQRHWLFSQEVETGRFLMTAMEDAHGNQLTIHYDSNNLPAEIIDSAGRRFLIQFAELRLSDGENVRRIVAVSCRHPSEPELPEMLCRYDYSEEGDLIAVRNGKDEVVRDFRYRNHIMVAHRLAGEMACFYHYDRHDVHGKVLAHRNSLGQTWQFDYQPNATLVTDVLGRKTRYEFDDNHELTALVNTQGGITRIKRNARGQAIAVTDPAGRITRYRYDERGNCTAVISPDGGMTRIDFHPHWNRPVRITDMLGASREFTWDVAGNLIREMDELGRITEYNHDDAGNLVRIRDAASSIQTLTWNAAGFLLSHTDCSGRTTQYSYDKYGWLKSRTDAAGNITTWQHNADGLPVKVSHADGGTEIYDYDRYRRLVSFTSAEGQRTHWELGGDGLPEARIDALGHRITYQYDEARRLTGLVNENGVRYEMAWDALDNLIRECGFDGCQTEYEYDASGWPVARKEYGNTGKESVIQTRWQRDAAGRLLEKLVAQGSKRQWQRTRYRYDANGRLITGINSGGRVELEWDAAGQLLREQTLTRGKSVILQHQYDELGNRTVTTLPDGREIRHFYYGSGHRIQVNWGRRVISESGRDALHREVRRTQGILTSEYVHDEAGRLISQRASYKNQLVVGREYAWRRDGQLKQMTDSHSGAHRYGYDALGRLTQAEGERFAFDPAHNLLEQEKAPPLRDNRLRVLGDCRWNYDAHGNVTEKRAGRHTAQRFHWNAEHQLEAAVTRRNGTEQRTRYGYDAFGRRSWKQDAFGVTHFIWDGNRLLSEERGNQQHIWIYEDEGFVPLAQISTRRGESEHDAQVYWYHTDQAGLPRELTGVTGEVAWRADYRAWGRTVRVEAGREDAGPVHQPLRFQGQYYDAETGLHYNRFRYYDPDAGRFISQDPIGLAGGLNLYQYAPNPLTWIDPWGLSKCGIEGRYKEIDKTDLPAWIKDSFKNGEYKTVMTTKEVTLYRVFGGNAKIDGSFVSTSPALNKIQAKIDSALLPEWKNTRYFEATIKVPKGTVLQVGKVEKQTMMSGAVLKGGADQILLPQGYPMSWISDVRFLQ